MAKRILTDRKLAEFERAIDACRGPETSLRAFIEDMIALTMDCLRDCDPEDRFALMTDIVIAKQVLRRVIAREQAAA